MEWWKFTDREKHSSSVGVFPVVPCATLSIALTNTKIEGKQLNVSYF